MKISNFDTVPFSERRSLPGLCGVLRQSLVMLPFLVGLPFLAATAHAQEPVRLVSSHDILQQRLFDSAVQGDISGINAAMSGGAWVDQRTQDISAMTPLLLAASNGRTLAVQTLLNFKANIEATDRGGQRPLHRAVAEKYYTTAAVLLQRGADPNAADAFGRTPLLLAVKNGDTRTVNLLLDKDKEPNFGMYQGSDALSWAVRAGNTDMITALLAKNPVKSSLNAALSTAYSTGQSANIVRLLKNAGAVVAPTRSQTHP